VLRRFPKSRHRISRRAFLVSRASVALIWRAIERVEPVRKLQKPFPGAFRGDLRDVSVNRLGVSRGRISERDGVGRASFGIPFQNSSQRSPAGRHLGKTTPDSDERLQFINLIQHLVRGGVLNHDLAFAVDGQPERLAACTYLPEQV